MKNNTRKKSVLDRVLNSKILSTLENDILPNIIVMVLVVGCVVAAALVNSSNILLPY